MTQLNLALCVSDEGTAAAGILSAVKYRSLEREVRPRLVIASSEAAADAFATHAGEMLEGIPVFKAIRRGDPGNLEYGQAIIAICQRYEVDFFGQYGWREQVPPNVIEHFDRGRRMIRQISGNTRLFGEAELFGRRALAAQLAFARFTGKDADKRIVLAAQMGGEEDVLNSSRVICFERVPIERGEDVDSLKKRIISIENRVQCNALRDIAQERARQTAHHHSFDSEPHTVERDTALYWAKRAAIALYPNG
jgi:folate-dependent phosphoribosylglycinamide formyltransferase PurN